MNERNRGGFTLVEMAVVLSIIGMVVGGILGGRSLLTNMQLRKVGADISSYQTNTGLFRQQYGELPGDFSRATEVWGAVGGGTAQCASPMTDSDMGLPTCNGDGNGIIDSGAASVENYRFFEHLAAAGFISGKFAGIDGSTTNAAVSGYNVPDGPQRGTQYWLYSWGIRVGSGSMFDGYYDNTFIIGKKTATWPSGASMTGKQAYGIDSKYDDGKPAYGTIRVRKSATYPNCISSDVSTTAVYLLNNQTIGCALMVALMPPPSQGGE